MGLPPTMAPPAPFVQSHCFTCLINQLPARKNWPWNLWWCSLLSWGEGWHNNHHANPRAWSYRERWWEWDPGAAVVWAILWLSNRGAKPGGASDGARDAAPATRHGHG